MEIKYLLRSQLKKTVKKTNLLIQFLVLPILLILIIGYLTKNNFTENITSYQYYSIPVMLFMYIGYGINSSFAFVDRYNRRGNFRLLYVPINPVYIYISHIISGTISGMVTALINLILIKYLFRMNYGKNFILILLTFTTIILVSNAIGIILSLVIDNAIVIEEIFTVSQLILCFMGGCFFELESIANLPRVVAYISPVKWVLKGINDIIYLGQNGILIITNIANIIILVLLVFLCVKSYKVEKYL